MARFRSASVRVVEHKFRVLGIDPSLSNTGFAYRKDGRIVTGSFSGGDMREMMRLWHMRKDLENLLDLVQPTHVAYEGYALGKRFGGQRGIYDTGELGGILKTAVWERGIHTILIPPSTLKVIVAGDGKVPDLIGALQRDFGYIIKQHDEADAAGLMLAGEMRCGDTTLIPERRKSSRIASLSKCEMIRGRLQLIAKGG